MPASPAKWQFIVTDLMGVVKGELLNLNDIKLDLPLMRVPTLSFSMAMVNPLATDLMDNDRLVKAYRTDPVTNTKRLVFFGPVVTVDENGEDIAQSVGVTCAGPFWRLTKRIIPGTDTQLGISRYPATGDEDLAILAHWILSNVNGGGLTGIQVGTRTGTFPRGVLSEMQLKMAADAIADLASGLNSFEFEVVPIEPVATGTWPYIGRMDISTAVGFVQRTGAIFEYGTTRANVTSYKRSTTREHIMTKGYITSPTWTETNTPNGLLTASTAEVSTRGLFEDVIPDGGMLDNAIRGTLLDEHLTVRKNPQQIITLQPAVNARPMAFVDFFLGDFVRARAVVRGSVRFDAMFRIWGISFGVDKNGNESVELEMTPP